MIAAPMVAAIMSVARSWLSLNLPWAVSAERDAETTALSAAADSMRKWPLAARWLIDRSPAALTQRSNAFLAAPAAASISPLRSARPGWPASRCRSASALRKPSA